MKHNHFFHILLAVVACMAGISCSRESSETDIIHSTEEIAGRDVAAVSGSLQELYLTQHFPTSHVAHLNSEVDGLTMLQTGKVDAMFTPSIVWKMMGKDFPKVVELQDGIDPTPMGIIFRKGNDDLRTRFNTFLAQYLATHDIEAELNEWASPDCQLTMPRSDTVTNPVGHLVIATQSAAPPFEFVRDGELVGVEAGLVATFAASEQMTWEFMDVAFSSIINCVQSGKADIGMSIICITPERQQSVDFSDAWYAEESSFLINKEKAPAELIADSDEAEKNFWQQTADSFYNNVIKEDRYKILLQGLVATVLVSVLAALLGTLLGALLCFCAMHRSPWVSRPAGLLIEFLRRMPQVVFLMVMFYIVFGSANLDGLWVAVITFALCFGAYTSVIFRSAVESIDKGQMEAALSMGFGRVKAFFCIILPQTVQRAFPVYTGEFIGLVKATSIVGYIAVVDLTKAGDIIRSRTYEAFFPLIIVTILYFLIIWLFAVILRGIEKQTRPQRKKFWK